MTEPGWIPWYPGRCPVPRETLVEVRLRCGKRLIKRAGAFAYTDGQGQQFNGWQHKGRKRDDILGYRLLEQ